MCKIAIILVNYNGINDSIECIKSIRKCNYYQNKQIKIIYVDNASNNDEITPIKEMFDDVVTIRSKFNGGFSFGNNLGIEWALNKKYEYIMLLNNDTIITNDLFEKLLKANEINCILTPKILYFDPNDVIWYGGGKIDKYTGNAVTFNLDKKDNNNDNNALCSFASGCCMLIPRKIFEEVGLLNEDFFMYCEDTEFCLRILKKGYKIKYVPSAKIYHKVGSSSGGNESPLNIYYLTRNRIELIKKFSDYFKCTALIYTIFTRYIRLIQMKMKKNPSWRFFIKGIQDGLKGITGKVDLS